MTYALLLDVSSLMYRAFFAWGQELRSPGGRPVGAVHGYLDMVTRLLVTRRPEEIVHVYDHEWRPVARTDMYAGYKANRPEDPEGLPEQFPMLRQVLDLTGMSQAMTRGWEAEDAIGAICANADPTAFSGAGAVTTVNVELDSEEEFVAMFDDAWPLALAKLKDIVESRS